MTIAGFEVPEIAVKAIFLAVVMVGGVVVSRILVGALRRVLERSEVPSASIFLNIVRAVIWVFALLIVLKPVFGIEPTGFVAALGVSSVALSLGLQDTISNLFGGLTLMIGKVIVPGDVITASGITGKVVDINLRSTTVELFSGDLKIIPNAVLSSGGLTKLAPFQAGEYTLPIMIARDADLEQVRADVDAAAREGLGEHYDPDFGTPVFIRGYSAFGILGQVSIHAKGISARRACTAVGNLLQDKPWLASAPMERQA